MGRRAKPAKVKARAKQPVARKAPKKDAATVRELEKRLAEGLEREKATGEILRVIGESPSDIQPVLDAMVERALRLCRATLSALFGFDGRMIRVLATNRISPEEQALADRMFPAPVGSKAPGLSRVIVERKVVHVSDIRSDPEWQAHASTRALVDAGGYRTFLGVPMMREGTCVGVIACARREVQPFTETQIALLQTFAGQAVIAIENVQLFTELQQKNGELTQAHAQVAETLEQQTATSEVLRVISSTQTGLEPVFATIVRNAGRVCDAVDAVISLADGDERVIVAHWGPIEAPLGERSPQTRGTVSGRAILDARAVHVEDLSSAPDFPEGQERAARWGHRTTLAVPLLRGSRAIGSLMIRRAEMRPFSDKQIAMLQTFADQAVIAIENVRLFTELQTSNRELTAALDTQTATGDILRVISGSRTDVQPVFDAILASAIRLLSAYVGALTRVTGDQIELAAMTSTDDAIVAVARALYPQSLQSAGAHAQAIRARAPLNIADAYTDPRLLESAHAYARFRGYQSQVVVPMLRHDEAIGTIGVTRREPGGFNDDEIALLRTFADQAVIAIENARLLSELQQRNEALTHAHAQVSEALDQQTATSEILRVISRAQTDAQPVFETIVRNAARLCGAINAGVYRFDGQLIHSIAHAGFTPEQLEDWRRNFPRPVHAPGVVNLARAIATRSVARVVDVDREPTLAAEVLANLRARGIRSTLAVPMLRQDEVIGVIGLAHRDVDAFSDTHIELLKTFADQAVIAIENVRLFTELQASNRELTAALDTQTATSDILRVISRSQTDVQPVFDAIVESAVRLLGAYGGALTRLMGDQIELVAHTSTDDAGDAALRARYPHSLHSEAPHAQVIRDRAPFNVADARTDPRFPEADRAGARARGFRSMVALPLLRHDEAIGVIAVSRREPGGFTGDEIALLQTFADQAVIAIENARLLSELQARNHDLTEALDQQTATSEILRVISRSQTDLQPVFDTIVASAVRLCQAHIGAVFQFDGEMLHLVAHHNFTPEMLDAVKSLHPKPPQRDMVSGRAIMSRAVVQIEDVLADREYHQDVALATSWRSMVAVPMLREGEPVGAIVINRVEPGAFADNHLELLKTFADQAVIAIENVRLFTELQTSNRELTKALDTQTATSDILRVISRSQTDVQPVFDAILGSAVRLLRGYSGVVTRIAGDQIELAALTSADAAADAAVRALFPRSLQTEGLHAQAIRDRAPLNIADAHTDPGMLEAWHVDARVRGYRSVAMAPMLRRDEAVGTLGVFRREPGGFTDDEIALLQTFADQAVIAIENARLLTELQERNLALTEAHERVTEALEQQTATSEILRVISSSPTDVQPVFDAITQHAVRLCDAVFSAAFTYDGRNIQLAAHHNFAPEALAVVRRTFPRPAGPETTVGRAISDQRLIHVKDTESDPDSPPAQRDVARICGYRSILFVPMLREGQCIGAINVSRSSAFSDKHIALLQTFTDQAVIAIENVRLFTELQTSNRELTTALDTQTATSDILRVISRSQTDVQPVFDAIVTSAVRLLRGFAGTLTRIAGDQIELAALTSTDDAADAAVRAAFPQSLQSGGPHAQAIRDRAPLNIADAHTDPRVPEAQRAVARVRGYRSRVVVPLLRHDEAIGAITVTRRAAGGFTDDEIALLQTFADQAVIAIENARLFNELQESNLDLTESLDRQTATADVLRVISQSHTDVQPVFDAIVQNAVRLCGAAYGGVYRVEDHLVHSVAHHGFTPEELEQWRRTFPRPLTGSDALARAITTKRVVRYDDLEAIQAAEISNEVRSSALARGLRSVVTVPMFRLGEVIGALSLAHRRPHGFSDAHVELLQTFADQAVIAIENARLLGELRARTAALTQSVDQLTALGEVGQAVSSSLDVDTVLNTIVGRAVELASADGGTLYEYDERAAAFELRVTTNVDDDVRRLQRTSHLRLGEGAVGMAGATRAPVQIPDIALDGAYDSRLRPALLRAGTRALLAVPLLREERIVGGLVVSRNTPGAFAPEIVSVLQTFATQSALAIQNARLFREIEIKSRELEVASQHKSEFLASMSHELRTPLNAIIGFSDVLLQGMFGETNDKQTEYLRDILASGQHLLSLINDILDLSKIEAGRMELDLAAFDLPTAIDDALLLMRERAGRRGITLERQVDERLTEIRGDQRKVKQVLLNLLSNAVKFTPEGGRIDVRAGLANGTAEISVTDSGIGIAPEDHEAVFEEFRQVGAAEKKAEGTGLGLALCRKFVELHGGRIWVKSQIGAGSTFTFTLPLVPTS